MNFYMMITESIVLTAEMRRPKVTDTLPDGTCIQVNHSWGGIRPDGTGGILTGPLSSMASYGYPWRDLFENMTGPGNFEVDRGMVTLRLANRVIDAFGQVLAERDEAMKGADTDLIVKALLILLLMNSRYDCERLSVSDPDGVIGDEALKAWRRTCAIACLASEYYPPDADDHRQDPALVLVLPLFENQRISRQTGQRFSELLSNEAI